MRTLILLAIGLALAALVPRLPPGRPRRIAVAGFALLWLAVVGWNLATGLSHGYTLAEELPIQLLILAPPVALAAWLGRRTPRR